MIGLSYVFYGWVGLELLPVAARAPRWLPSAAGPGSRPPAPSGPGASPWPPPSSPTSALLGWFKYYGFFVTSVVNFLGTLPALTTPTCRCCAFRAAARHLVLHVPGHELRGRRLPGRARAGLAARLRVYMAFFPYLVAGPSRGRPSSCPSSRPPRPGRVESRAFFLILAGLVKKMLIADYLATQIVAGVHHTGAVLVARGASRPRLRGADLLRLQRLHRHRHRHRAAARLPVPQNFNAPVHGADLRTSGAAGT